MASRITTLLTATALAVLVPLGGASAAAVAVSSNSAAMTSTATVAAPAVTLPALAHAQGTATFGIQPKPNPGERAAFSYNANAGASVRDTVVVSNFGDQPLILHIYANDAINTTDGGFDLRPSAEPPKDSGAWVTFDDPKKFQTLPPKSKLELPFTLAVPANATPGDHVAGIVAVLSMPSTDGKGNRVNVEQRVGSRIYLRVAGDLKAQLSVTHAEAEYHGSWNPLGGSADITYLITNTGNVRLGAAQSVHVTTPFGGTVRADALKDFEQLLPGNSVRVTTKVKGIIPVFSATAHIDVDPQALPGDLDPKAVGTSGTAGMTPIPWQQLLVLVLLIGVWYLLRLRKRRLRAAVANGGVRPVSKAAAKSAAAAAQRAAKEAAGKEAADLAGTADAAEKEAEPVAEKAAQA